MQNMISTLSLLLLLYGIRFAISVAIAKESFHMTGADCGGDCSANAMLDNNGGTFWNAYNNVNYATPAWVTFDFGTAVRISGFDLASYGDTTHDTKDFTLQSAESVDGPFTTFYTNTAAAATEAAQHFSIDITAQSQYGFQFVRLNLVTRYSGYQGCVREVDFEYENAEAAPVQWGYECSVGISECKLPHLCTNIGGPFNNAMCGGCVADDGVSVFFTNDWYAADDCCDGYHFVEGNMYWWDNTGYCSQSTLPTPYEIEVGVASVMAFLLFVFVVYALRVCSKAQRQSTKWTVVACDTSDAEADEPLCNKL